MRRARPRKMSRSLKARLDVAKGQDWRWKHFKRQDGRCIYCDVKMMLGTAEKPFQSHRDCTLDHLVPTSRGGAHHWENTAAACRRCNELKGDMTAEEFTRVRVSDGNPSGAKTEGLRAEGMTARPDAVGGRPEGTTHD